MLKSLSLIFVAGSACLFALTAFVLKDFKSVLDVANCAAAVEAALIVSVLGNKGFV